MTPSKPEKRRHNKAAVKSGAGFNHGPAHLSFRDVEAMHAERGIFKAFRAGAFAVRNQSCVPTGVTERSISAVSDQAL